MVSSGSHWPSKVFKGLCTQSESGQQMHLQPAHLPFGPQKNKFYPGQFVIWPRLLTIITICVKNMKYQGNGLLAGQILYEPSGPWSGRLSPVSVVLSG